MKRVGPIVAPPAFSSLTEDDRHHGYGIRYKVSAA